MRTQTRAPIVEYRSPQPFNTPTIRRPPDQAPPQSVPVASQTAPKTEKAPAPGPKPKLSQEAFWSQFAGKSLTFQCRSGAVITGTLDSLQKNFLKLTDSVVIVGRNSKATTAFCYLDCNSISHFHGDAVVEAIS